MIEQMRSRHIRKATPFCAFENELLEQFVFLQLVCFALCNEMDQQVLSRASSSLKWWGFFFS